jgi:hypothetical protein
VHGARGVDLPEPAWNLRDLVHGLTVVDLVAAAERSGLGRVQTERELRRLARLEGPEDHSVSISIPGYGRRIRHFPDLAAERPGGAR